MHPARARYFRPFAGACGTWLCEACFAFAAATDPALVVSFCFCSRCFAFGDLSPITSSVRDGRRHLVATFAGATPERKPTRAGYDEKFQRAIVSTSAGRSPSLRTTDGSNPECMKQFWHFGSWRDSQ